MTGTDRKVVAGFKLPYKAPLTSNELAWIDMLRMIVGDSDPKPTFAAVQAMTARLRAR